MSTKAKAQKAKRKKKYTPPAPPVRTIEVDGLTLTLDVAAMDDVELFDMIDRFGPDSPDTLRLVPKMLRALFGDAQFETVMAHLRQHGRVGFEVASEFLAKVFAELDPNS